MNESEPQSPRDEVQNPMPGSAPDSAGRSDAQRPASVERGQHGSDADRGRERQPEYGRIVRPRYGALSADFPPGYDPYLYGPPDKADDDSRLEHPSASSPVSSPSGVPSAQTSPTGQVGTSGQTSAAGYGPRDQRSGNNTVPAWGAPGQPGRPARLYHGIDLDDPSQNPLFGHWDVYAVVAFIFSLSSIPLLPAIMGAVSMWRTRTFRMKGFGLALAAVILNVLVTVMDVWMLTKGISMNDMMQWLQTESTMDGGQGSGSLSA